MIEIKAGSLGLLIRLLGYDFLAYVTNMNVEEIEALFQDGGVVSKEQKECFDYYRNKLQEFDHINEESNFAEFSKFLSSILEFEARTSKPNIFREKITDEKIVFKRDSDPVLDVFSRIAFDSFPFFLLPSRTRPDGYQQMDLKFQIIFNQDHFYKALVEDEILCKIFKSDGNNWDYTHVVHTVNEKVGHFNCGSFFTHLLSQAFLLMRLDNVRRQMI